MIFPNLTAIKMRLIKPFPLLVLLCAFLSGCTKESNDINRIESAYSGSYKNVTYTESLVGDFSPGIYKEDQIPADIMNMEYGRIEIDFRYNGGGLTYFAPLFYYGSINKNDSDDYTEEPQFHLAVEIGHYNVIPMPVENLFYTICTYNYPQYCRDTYFPVLQGIEYSLVIDKKPEGIILQLKEGTSIVNIFPDAFFPDSVQMFFKDVTAYTDAHKGDSLQKVMMVGKGFAGIERGIHDFNGEVSGLHIYKYALQDEDYEYELLRVRNQHTANQQITYSIRDKRFDDDKYIVLKYEYRPYKFESDVLVPNGAMQTVEQDKVPNNRQLNYRIKTDDMGFYKIHLQTVDENGNILGSTKQPFEIWVYPREWDFEFY
jgi:hypothetical protein